MASMVKVILIGNVGNDPVMKTVGDRKVAEFSIAINENTRRNAQDNTPPTWYRVSVWDNRADIIMNYVRKGNQIYVEGKLSINNYIDKSGVNQTSLNVIASDFQFIGSRDDSQRAGGNYAPPQGGGNYGNNNMNDNPGGNYGGTPSRPSAPNPAISGATDDDDLPF